MVIKPGVSNETLDISSRVVITKQAILNTVTASAMFVTTQPSSFNVTSGQFGYFGSISSQNVIFS